MITSTILKNLFSLILMGMFAFSLQAQDKSQLPSPPAEATATVGKATITINYSSPGVKGREIWGGLVPFDKVWRTGANEATTFETSEALIFGDQKLEAGKYGFFTIPTKESWTIIFNSNPDQWGSYNYSAKKDVLRVQATPAKSDSFNERMTFLIEKDDNQGVIKLLWENLVISLPFTTGM